ncbi:unnamed protein product [Mycena citricolor]|uniref:phosphatidylinositol 3-kinase n=1 Tax=Mycena citricolor TaxID=2018698 RepID=A0AAD2GYP7_9AGAR|nr:unnamed protein product [Mycena citricolor]
MDRLRPAGLLALSLAAFANAAVQVTVPATPALDPNAQIVQSNFLGISFELSFMPEYFGNDTSTLNQPMLNYMGGVRARSGSNPTRIRIGGNSADSSPYYSQASSPMVQLVPGTYNANDQPVTYNSMLWSVMADVSKSVGGVAYVINVPLALPPNASLSDDMRRILGKDLDSMLLGNEPDLYSGHGKRPGMTNYTVADYLGDFSSGLNVIGSKDVAGVKDVGGPSDLLSLLQQGYLSQFTPDLKYIVLQHYPQNNCFGSFKYQLPYYLQHANVVELGQWQKPGIDYLYSQPATGRPTLINSEFNSASCGGVPYSPAFGVGSLWIMDYSLQMAAVGYTQAYIHTREAGISYNMLKPPIGPAGTAGAWVTNSPYYALLAVTEALLTDNGAHVVDLNLGGSSSNVNVTTAGYAVYNAGNQTVSRLILFNYGNSSTDFAIPGSAFSSSGTALVKFLAAATPEEETNISWGGETWAPGDGKSSGSPSWAVPNQNLSGCSTNGCTFTAPGPSMAMVFLDNAQYATIAAVNPSSSSTGTAGGSSSSPSPSSGGHSGAAHVLAQPVNALFGALLSVLSSQLEGVRQPRTFTELLDNPELRFHGVQSPTLSDLYVTCQLTADNKPLTIPFRTSFKAFKHSYTWNEWITLPVRYCDLPLGAQIVFTVWDIAGPRAAIPVGGSTFRMFGKKWTLRRGKHRLHLWRDVEGDGSVDSATPSKLDERDEMGRLEKLVKKYERGDLSKCDWLDKMAFRKMEEVHAAETAKSENLFLYIDLPRFDFPVIFSEPEVPTASTSALPIPSAPIVPSPSSTFSSEPHLWAIIDPDIARENPVEDKHRRLVRSHRSSPYDRELKPNAKIRDELAEILSYAPSQPLTSEEKDLIWKFRFYLVRDKRGLTKFLKSVTWRDSSEVKQAVEELLPQWTEIDTDDALELLGPGTVDSRVRAFAELLLYLLQLVQALKFESTAADQRSSRTTTTSAISYDDSGLTDFLISRGVSNAVLGNRLYWYLIVEVAQDQSVAKMYGRVVFRFMNKIVESEGGSERRELMRRQGLLIDTLAKRANELRTSKDPRNKKIEKLRGIITDTKNNLASMAPLPLPLNASIEITGIVAEQSSVFKSNLFPLLLYFQCSDGSTYPVIFKDGDDMRQDQLVIQLFTLMDRLLRKENLDLKLSPYDVLATGPLQGMAQFIPSKTIAAIVSEHGNLLNYLRAHNPDAGSVVAVTGYCVVTYLLGVGDRHLDNLLLAPDGHFFHVDFGYILGRDPKPFPPAVKVCKEMVDGMGGVQSPHYARFKNFCFTAFTILRKSANLILNLVSLMVDANIPDIKHRDVHEQLQEKFRLDLTEEEAIKHFETLLNETSYITVVFDRIHDMAQYWRS